MAALSTLALGGGRCTRWTAEGLRSSIDTRSRPRSEDVRYDVVGA